jgi:hypothetical protein
MTRHTRPAGVALRRALAGSLLVLPLLAGSLAGQFRLLPSIGLYAPVSDFGEVRESGVGGAVEFGKAESTLALGLAAEFGSGEGALAFRANLVYGTQSDVPIDGVGCETCSARSTLLVATGGVVLRPLPTLVVVRPYLLAGAGIKRFDFDRDSFEDEGFSGVLGDGSDATLQLGLGTDLVLGGLSLFVEGNAYLSRYDPGGGAAFDSDSDVRTDMVLSAGVSLGF